MGEIAEYEEEKFLWIHHSVTLPSLRLLLASVLDRTPLE